MSGSYSDQFEEGRKAYEAGLSENQNPYDQATQRAMHDEWADGWEYEWGNYFGERAEA